MKNAFEKKIEDELKCNPYHVMLKNCSYWYGTEAECKEWATKNLPQA